jgi:hypothetical protein
MSVSDVGRALARVEKNLKKDIPWISVSAVGMFEGCLADIQRIGPMSEVDIFWTSTGLTCVMWVGGYWVTNSYRNQNLQI